MEYDIKLIYDNLDISDYVTRVAWLGQASAASRQLDVEIIAGEENKDFTVENGKLLRFYNRNRIVFVGVVFSFEINTAGSLAITAFDENYYLSKSTDSRIVANQTASSFIRNLCSDFGVPIGEITETGYVIKSLVLVDKTLISMIGEVLTITRKQTGRRFIIGNDKGKLTLKEFATKNAMPAVDVTHLLTSASYLQSIEDTKTRVKVVGGKGDKHTATAKSNTLTQKYGVLQHFEIVSEDATASQVKQRADELLRQLAVINDEARIALLGDDRITAGQRIYIEEKLTGIVGDYYVSSDSHTFSNGVHTMELVVSATYDGDYE